MNRIQNVVLFKLCIAIITTPLAAQAQTCATPNQTPLTKTRLDQIASSQGVSLSKLGVTFESFALRTIKPGDPIPRNNRRFASPLRQSIKGIANVVPDAVVPLVVNIIPFLNPQTYADSVFYEAKAVKNRSLPPSYEDYQILGLLDALGKSSARAAGENPAIVFMTTSDVRKISNKTITEATSRRIGVWHSIGCEVTPLSGDLQMGQAALINPSVYFITGRIPTGAGGPGSIGRL